MGIWDVDKLILFVAFVVPGFISLKIYELLAPTDSDSKPSQQVIDAVAYSCMNYGLLSPVVYIIFSRELWLSHFGWFLFLLFFTLFIAPVVWSAGWFKLRKTRFFKKRLPHPIKEPWDYVFSQRKPHWLKVKLKNGELIAGRYSGKSFASDRATEKQLYLEEAWLLNDTNGFDRPKRRSEGVIILPGEISYVELFSY